MKKILLLILLTFTTMASAESFICTGLEGMYGEEKITTEIYKRVGDKFTYQKGEADLVFDYFFEDNEIGVLVLQSNFGPSIYTVLIDKNRLKARIVFTSIELVYEWEADCKLAD